MKGLKRNILMIFIILIFIFIVSFGRLAFSSSVPVVDNAGLLSVTEKENLILTINEFKKNYDIDLVIVTNNGVDGKSASKFADDFYEKNSYGVGESNSGILLLVDMVGRNIWISTEGEALKYFSDDRLDSIIEDIGKYLSNGEYLDGFNIFITDVKYYMDLGVDRSQYLYSESGNTIKMLFISLLVAVIVATISCLAVNYSYKTPKGTSSINYVDRNSIVFNKKKDIFINTYTTRTKIEKNNDINSGKTTIHNSDSGRTHGGRGGNF